MKKLLVVGSINMDIVSNVNEFPLPGETIPSIATSFFPGGKGANQAVAAARAGASCQVIGAVGEDPFAETLTSALHNNGIATDQILRKKEVQVSLLLPLMKKVKIILYYPKGPMVSFLQRMQQQALVIGGMFMRCCFKMKFLGRRRYPL